MDTFQEIGVRTISLNVGWPRDSGTTLAPLRLQMLAANFTPTDDPASNRLDFDVSEQADSSSRICGVTLSRLLSEQPHLKDDPVQKAGQRPNIPVVTTVTILI